MARTNRIDRYKPEKLLGSGGLVDTFRAQVDGGPTRVVLKVLFLDRADERITRPAAERFLRAGRRCQEVSQPGIGRVIDVSDDPTAAFVATELVPGTDLAQLLARSPQVSDVRNKKRAVAPNVAAMVCAQIAQTVDRAHSHSPALSHLGLAPGNIIVTADGGVTVLDFGLMASVRKDGLCPVQKWHFVAPELVGKEAWEVPPGAALAADLYALGALLYFMLTGSPPTSPEAARSPTELVRQSRPLSFPAGLPDGLVHAMRILTAVDPADRPTSAKTAVEMLRAESQNCRLDHALRALGVSPPPTAEDGVSPKTRPVTTPGPRPLPRSSVESGANNRRDARRGRLDGAPRPGRGWAGKTVASAALLAALGMYFGLRSRRPRPSPSVAPTEVPAKPRANEPPITPAVPALPRANPEIPGPGHGYVPDPERVPVRLPGHLFIDTSPSQAAVWIDGSLRGKTPVDLEVGPGVHRMIAVKPGYRMWLAVYDTTQGEFARREFQAASPPIAGDAFLDVRCPVPDRYPIILDDEETGLLCPVERLPVVSGKHTVGIFVPARRANVTSSVVALRGRQPLRVDLKD